MIGTTRRRALPAVMRGRDAQLVIGALAAVVVLLLVVPAGEQPAAGTPLAIAFRGLIAGMTSALGACAIVLVFRTLRIINFAQTALGIAAVVLLTDLLAVTGIPFAVVFPLSVLTGVGIGVAFDLVFGRRFARAPRLVYTVLTIALAQLLALSSRQLIESSPIFTDQDRDTLHAPHAAVTSHLPFGGLHFQLGTLAIRFGFADLLALGLSIVLLAGLGLFLQRTRLGAALRAAGENSERASLLGIGVGSLSTIVWAIAGLFGAVAATLAEIAGTAPSTTGASASSGIETLLVPLAAAVLARMRSLSVAMLAAVGITLVEQAVAYHYADAPRLFDLALLVVLVGAVILGGSRLDRADRGGGVAALTTADVRPIPRELLAIKGLRVTRWIAAVLGCAALVLLPFVVSVGTIDVISVVVLNGIVGLSIVLLTGWAGQVSLGQYGLVAVGSQVAGVLVSRQGIPFLIAVPATVLLTAAVATVIGIPALRLPGLFLAATTFAFAVAAHSVLFDDHLLGWLQPGVVTRPSVLGLDLGDERVMYGVCLLALLASMVVLRNLRRGRLGRVLIAVRDNEVNAQSAGINPARTKLAAFAISGGLAGLAGALLAVQQRGVAASSFEVTSSFAIFGQVVLGGVSTIGGSLLGVAYIGALFQVIGGSTIGNVLAGLLGPGMLLLVMYVAPGGAISLVVRIRDAVLRVVAQRRGLVVPSLFTDIDPEALRARLIPLGATPPDETPVRRYRVASALHLVASTQGSFGSRRDAERMAAAAVAAGEGVPELVGSAPRVGGTDQ